MEPGTQDAATTAQPAAAPGWRALKFRFDGTCGANCGVPISAGEAGFWNPGTKELRHASCSPSAAVPRPEGVPWTGLPTPNDDWQRLVAYCRACVLREGLAEPPAYEDVSRLWAVVPGGRESIIAGTDGTLPIGGPIASVIAGHRAALESGRASGTPEELAYGWPLVVCRDSRGKLRCAPLAIAAVQSPGDRATELTIDRDSVQLNLAVADPRFQPDADPDLVRLIAEEPLPVGQAGVLAGRLREIALQAGLTVVESLDANALRDGRPPGGPGVYNRAVVLRREPSRMTGQLLADLRSMFFARGPDWAQTSAARLLGGRVETVSRAGPVVSFGRLNDSQEAAVRRALASPVSVITGPPGTGKSQFVAALVATARDRDLKVLVASTNNGAVDEAVERASSPHLATILRTGNADYRRKLIGTLDEICGGRGRSADGCPRDDGAAGDRDRARDAHRARTVRRDQVRDRLGARAVELERLDEAAVAAAEAADALWHGPPPVDLAADPGGVLGRAVPARRRWRRRARNRLLVEMGVGSEFAGGNGALDTLIEWARATLELRLARERLADEPEGGEWREWEECNDAWMVASRTLVAATAQSAIDRATERLEGLLKAYRADDGRQGRALVAFLDVLPAWGTSALSVRSSFACNPAIFDLVVIDEASQCTLPAILPLAFRAKQIVIVGDPHQLPPVVTVPAQELEHLPGTVGLDADLLADRGQLYGVDSAYTAFSKLVEDELLLDEHYRCHPEIAGYCDQEFYAGALHVLTDTFREQPQPVRGLQWSQVDGQVETGRIAARTNEAEVDAIVRWIGTHEPALRRAGATLGIVTPFASQANLLQRRVGPVLDRSSRLELDLRIGTAHTFQGAERDVMLFSPVIATGAQAGTIDWLEMNRYLVNVAVSRARVGLVVLGDARHLRDLGAVTLAVLYDHATSRAVAEPPAGSAEAGLISHLPVELDVRLGQRVGDHPARMTVGAGKRTTVVVVDRGGAGPAQRLRELLRDQIMISAGAGVVRVPAWLCRHDPRAAADRVVGACRSVHAADPKPADRPADPRSGHPSDA